MTRLGRWIIFSFSLPAIVSAQGTARVTGSVIDPAGAVIPGASVELYLHGGKRPLLSTKTGSSGLFSIESVRPAGITVWLQLTNQPVAAETVVIAAGQVSERWLAGELSDAGIAHVVIGGAHNAAELDAELAFREGLETPRRIARLIGSRA